MTSLFDKSADAFGNDEQLELNWAMKAFHHAETYFKLITALDPKYLKLTQVDDEIYTLFRDEFKDLKVDILSEDTLKNPEAKKKWRAFCMKFEQKVEDFNMGTLLRLDANGDITENNTTLVPRIQFLTIEIARNREGHNSGLKEKYQQKKNQEST